MRAAKQTVENIFKLAGYKISKIPEAVQTAEGYYSPYGDIIPNLNDIVDLEALKSAGDTVPGMISTHSGEHLFSLCYFQSEKGDVVEIGSWQGRSAVFLGHAVKSSGNGNFYAIDHFGGNVGKEHFYVVGKNDLSDLEDGFNENIKQSGLTNTVNLLAMSNKEAADKIEDNSVRFLFIDGDHTRAGIEADISLFFPKLIDGALVVFDDCSGAFPDVVSVLGELLKENKHSRVMTYPNTLVLKYRKK